MREGVGGLGERSNRAAYLALFEVSNKSLPPVWGKNRRHQRAIYQALLGGTCPGDPLKKLAHERKFIT
jgi:hypothetical protein